MKIDIKTIVHRIDPVLAIAKSITVLSSYWLGSLLTEHVHPESRLMGAMLAAISSIVVLQADVKTSLHQGMLRVLGTFIGAVIASIYLMLFPFTLTGMVFTVLVLEVFCMMIGIPGNGRMATITLVVILVISKQSPSLPPVINAFLRFSEASVGAIISISLAYGIEYFRGKISASRKQQ